MDRKKEVRRYLRRTMEVKLLVRNLWLWLLVSAVFALALYLNTKSWVFSVAMLVTLVMPYLIWFAVRYARIMAKAESYCFYRAKLDSPHPSLLIRNRFYFKVALDEENGTHTVVDTHAVFHTYGIFFPKMDACLNQNVGIAYNPDTKMVIVAG